ncbi:MAG: NAD-dependent epimerase [Alkalispirochaeta sp.]
MKILLTGIAGFIGFHIAGRLLERGDEVVGIDNINDYYDVDLKLGRLSELGITPAIADKSTRYTNLHFVKMDMEDRDGLKELLEAERFDCVIHLAAQAGVRYSLTNPHSYISSNVEGFLSLLEAVRHAPTPVEHLVYASSSSVYGLETEQPFREDMAADQPVSLYAATKRSNELMAHSYAHLYGLPITGLRFFTVYGSWYRPDMALYRFADAMTAGKPIQIYNYGKMERDFTYVDDIVEGIIRVLDRPATGTPPYRVYNIGNGAPVPLMELVKALEEEMGITAEKEMLPMQPGDVTSTWADCTALQRDTGYRPDTPVRDGVKQFVEWYNRYHR